MTRFTSIAAVAILAACGSGGDSTTAPPTLATPTGSYTISSVNGKALPAVVASDTSGLYKLEITAGTLSLAADGTYSVVTNSRVTIPSVVSLYSDSTGGTWVLTGTNVMLRNGQDGTTDTAMWSNTGQLTFAEVDGTTTTTFIYGLKK